ncbi:Wzz/FepE/Etk N-terminal domain-containing protein [Frondihabitans peucedani]|uniref:Polysaccharide biosynthesis tyrosine autokinase n=1 Tax=Frondihabitans peucedani TaxID=598626 RepID=A0ABP8E114_9MICO
MDPKDYWKALRKSWIVLVALTLVGGIVGYGFASTLADSYKSESSLFVASSGNTSGSDLLQGSTFTQNVVQSYAELATTSSVLTPVIAELNLDTTPTKLARQIDAQVPLNTVFVNITVTDSSATRAASISNSVARSLRSVATDLAPTSSSGKAPVAISIVAPALVPQNPSGPNRHLIEISAALIGLVVGILYAIGRLLFDTRLRTVDDLQARSGVPVIGATRRGAAGQLALRDAPDSALAEDVRRISATLRFAGDGGLLRTLTLTSASRTGESSGLALDLALAVAERGARVLVIDADLRAPSLARLASVDDRAGLSDVLAESATLEEATTHWTGSVDLLTTGGGHSNPHFALGSNAMGALVREVAAAYDLVIVQTASVLDYADALTIGHLTDATAVTVRSRSTNRRQLRSALDSLENAKTPVVGLVLTDAKLGGRTRRQEQTGRSAPLPAAAPTAGPSDGAHADRSVDDGVAAR